jgi:hypothetical protein
MSSLMRRLHNFIVIIALVLQSTIGIVPSAFANCNPQISSASPDHACCCETDDECPLESKVSCHCGDSSNELPTAPLPKTDSPRNEQNAAVLVSSVIVSQKIWALSARIHNPEQFATYPHSSVQALLCIWRV